MKKPQPDINRKDLLRVATEQNLLDVEGSGAHAEKEGITKDAFDFLTIMSVKAFKMATEQQGAKPEKVLAMIVRNVFMFGWEASKQLAKRREGG